MNRIRTFWEIISHPVIKEFWAHCLVALMIVYWVAVIEAYLKTGGTFSQ